MVGFQESGENYGPFYLTVRLRPRFPCFSWTGQRSEALSISEDELLFFIFILMGVQCHTIEFLSPTVATGEARAHKFAEKA